LKRIYFTVTNDLTFDQRMHRICNSLSGAGYEICLVGRKLNSSLPLEKKPFRQIRIRNFFNKGFIFYAEYNIRLFFLLLFHRMDVICSIDLDTILPGLIVSKLRNIIRVYDAHEYFTEMKEVRTRKNIKKMWTWIEKVSVPRYESGYTVSQGLANAFREKYNRNYKVIRNFPLMRILDPSVKKERFILYHGAVNEGRGFEYLIPAIKKTMEKLVICGDGNFMNQLVTLIQKNDMQQQVELKGMVMPDELFLLAQRASLGVGLAEKDGINQYYSLANKFTDYIHAGLPQVAMDYPEYHSLNEQFEVAILINDLSTEGIATTISAVMNNQELLERLHVNCLEARKVFNWQSEERILIQFYKNLLSAE
jgi:glycosyltransferase involved in cell wall biosynthesis